MQGKVIIFSAPSGAGKTTIAKQMLKEIPNLEFSVSACSRPKRAGEREGVDYYFLSPEEFKQKIEEGAFLEYEEVYPGSYYGTLKSELERIWQKDRHVMFDVDTIGGMRVKDIFKNNALSVFIKPPDVKTLEERLRARGTETEETIRKRMARAEFELSFADKFDRVVVNDSLEKAVKEVKTYILDFIS